MTHEEAIAFLEQYINSEVYTEKCISAHEMAITALRSAHAGEAMGYHFLIPHTTKMVPLTLEQLREMDGWPVYLPEVNCWALVTKDVFATLLTFPDGERCSANDWYEQVGPAYTFHSACIDREAWKPCGECAPNCSWCKNNDESSRTTPKVCRECKRHSNYEPEYKFCCECGRPLTEEAWAIWRRGWGCNCVATNWCIQRGVICDRVAASGYCAQSACTKVFQTGTARQTNADRIRAMSDQELAAFLSGVCYGRDEPWERAFKAACCDCCPTVKGTDEYGRHYNLHDCDFADGICPHGDSILWWLVRSQQEE